jgi:hypothetical protein
VRAFASLVLLAAACATGRTAGGIDSALQRELLARRATDQGIRDTMVALLQAGGAFDTSIARRMMQVDSANTAWLKGIVADRGWPRRSVVGEEGANAAFLIVQHAVQDTAFQAAALALMERAAADSEARGADVAMLADRLAVQRGGKQRYGTQAKIVDGRVVLDPIDDSANVDARRATLGMPGLARYVEVLESVYTARPRP